MSQPKQTNPLPPRHSGYRATTSGRFETKSVKDRVLPKPPTGDAGGSKSAKTSNG